ncbi:MAG: hypothetical protein QNJ00_05585 [Woeseiaceae bacterium]|nr:hypothetical protein [Woeseiaceae bacterium]
MKKKIVVLMAAGLPLVAHAQGQSLASTMEMYVFPAEGQETSQQSKDEAECYEWGGCQYRHGPVRARQAGGHGRPAGAG